MARAIEGARGAVEVRPSGTTIGASAGRGVVGLTDVEAFGPPRPARGATSAICMAPRTRGGGLEAPAIISYAVS